MIPPRSLVQSRSGMTRIVLGVDAVFVPPASFRSCRSGRVRVGRGRDSHDEATCVGQQTKMGNLTGGTVLRRDDGNPSRDALEVGDAALMR